MKLDMTPLEARARSECPCMALCTTECRWKNAVTIIQDLVEHVDFVLQLRTPDARPSFPKTPFRKALDDARAFLEKETYRGEDQRIE